MLWTIQCTWVLQLAVLLSSGNYSNCVGVAGVITHFNCHLNVTYSIIFFYFSFAPIKYYRFILSYCLKHDLCYCHKLYRVSVPISALLKMTLTDNALCFGTVHHLETNNNSGSIEFYSYLLFLRVYILLSLFLFLLFCYCFWFPPVPAPAPQSIPAPAPARGT